MNKISFTLFLFSLSFSCSFSIAAESAALKKALSIEDKSVQITSNSERIAFYRWLVAEMHEQIFLRPVQKKSDIDAWANVFAQGGSIEGVYHGLILSTQYADMENGKADIKSLRFFAQEMAGAEQKKNAEKLIKEHMNSSVFTLKRLLGEKMLSEIEKRKNNREALSAWYVDHVTRWNELEISFGMKQRNLKDESFHKKWAMENSIGLVQWETLNRIHRIFNSYAGFVVSTNPAGK